MSYKHHFLLAMPELAPNYFANTLTYICEHSKDGAMGIIVNRATDTTLVEMLGSLHLSTNTDYLEDLVLEGGPVASNQGFVLHNSEQRYDGCLEVDDGITLSSSIGILKDIADSNFHSEFIVALGYAGWAEGQLEQEMAANAWLSMPASSDVLFGTSVEQRLDAAISLLGFDFRLIAKPGSA